MGKSKGGRRSRGASGRGGSGGGRGGGNKATVRHGHSTLAGGSGGASSFGGGMINPAFLAAAARDAAARRQQQQQRQSTASSAASPAGSSSSTSKKRKKRKRGGDDEAVANNSDAHVGEKTGSDKSKKKRKKNGTGNTHHACIVEDDEVAGKVARAVESKNDKKKKNGGGSSDANGCTTLTFGHPHWTDLEQLVRLLLFPLPWVADAIAASSLPTKTQMKQSPKPRKAPCPILRIIFVSQADRVRELAMLCKPLLHPMPVLMIHNKMKRRQLEDGMRELLTSLTADDGDEGSDTNREGDDSMPSRGPVIFVADSALDRMVSAFRSCRSLYAGTISNAITKAKGGKKKSKKQGEAMAEKYCTLTDEAPGGRFTPLGVHFDIPKSGAFRKARSSSLSNVATALETGKAKTANRYTLEIVLDGKQTEPNPGYADRNVFLDCIDGRLTTIASATSSSEWIPQQSNQQIVEGLVISAKRVREGPVGSPKERSAKEKLLARMTVLDARLQAKTQPMSDETKVVANVGLPAVPGITDIKLSAVVEKMRILGMIAPTNTSEQSEREAAQTRWFDNAKGRSFGGTWKGSIRFGASGDNSSRELASKLAIWRSGGKFSEDANGVGGNSDYGISTQCLPCGKGEAWRSLVHWAPNPSSGDVVGSIGDISDDEDDEGRKDFGSCPCAKACGHNETAMFYLRPFFPLEVVNSRVCSKKSPAPGNAGFEGCLEYLRRLCAAAGRSLIYWDSECFGMIDGRDGERCKGGLAPVIRLPKRELLMLPKGSLQEILDHGRQLAMSSAGAESSQLDSLPPISRRIKSVLSNDLRAKMAAVGLLQQSDEATT